MTTTPHPSPLIPTTARAGLTFGLILVVMYVARLLSFQIPLLQILYFFGIFTVPIVAYRGARAYRDYFYPTQPFRLSQGFGYVVLLHVFGGILAFIPQYFYFRFAMPPLLAAWEEALRTAVGHNTQVREMILQLQGITLWQWLWTDYCLTIILGGIWGLITGLILRRK